MARHRAAAHYIPTEELKQEDYAVRKEFVDGGCGDDYDMATFAKTVVAGMEEIIASHRATEWSRSATAA